jgi:predicted RNA methylase
MDYPQETIDTLRNLVKAQADQIAHLKGLRDLDDQLIDALHSESLQADTVIAEQREIINIDRKLHKVLQEIIDKLKDQARKCSATEI